MKKINYLIIGLTSLFVLNSNVNAAASLSTSSSKVYNGSSFTTTVSLSGVASWEVHVKASGPVSGCVINAADATENATNGSKSYSVTCKATGTGNITVNLSGNTTTESGTTNSISGTRTVQAVNKPSTSAPSTGASSSNKRNNTSKPAKREDNKSSNNNLKSLGIEGYKLNPEFSKDKTDYTLTVPNDVNKIKILAYKEDDKASLSGDDGEKEIKEGENKFTVVVKAENGSEKKYNITVTVDSKPIIVKTDGKEYNVIKKKEELPKLDIEHEDLTLNIEEQEVPAYRIDNISYILVGLKDESGNVNLYKFDSFKDNEKPAEYKLFSPLSFDTKMINIIDFPKNKIPLNYKKYKVKINDQEITAYKLNKNSKYSLIYGVNLETGKENIYRYDSAENTIQIFEREEANLMEKEMENYKYVILGLTGFSLFLVLIIIIISFSKRKQKSDKETLTI